MGNIFSKFPSKTLRASDLQGDTVLTIADVGEETVGQGEAAEVKPVVYFQEEERGLILNKTNATTIASLYGPDTDDWAGKQVTLFPTEVDFQGKQVEAIRVKKRVPVAPQRDAGAGRKRDLGPPPAPAARAGRQAPVAPRNQDAEEDEMDNVPF